jgi:hypothetical protein
MNYTAFLTRYTPAELPNLYFDWQWLVPAADASRAVAMTQFGYLFFEGEDGTVYYLDTLEGEVMQFARTRNDAAALLALQENQQTYLLSALVTTLREQGRTLNSGELYVFRTHPAAGGEATSDNVDVVSMRVALSITGQLHQQLQAQAQQQDQTVGQSEL